MAAVAGGGLVPGSALHLKGDVLALLLSHPGGIPLHDFGSLFQQHHGRHLDLPGHGYRSLHQLLGDMKELIVLDEDGKEPRVRCWHPACDPRGAEPRNRHHHHCHNHKEAPPKPQQGKIPRTAPRPWNSRHHLVPPASTSPGHPPVRSAPRHHASAPVTQAVFLSCFPGSHLPVAVPWQVPLLTFGNQPLGLVTCAGSPLNISAPAPSRLPCPASPQLLDPASQPELEQNVAQVLRAHPRGISLFRFRQIYSATYSNSFPLDSSASVKEQLATMPGTVRMEGWGVQTLLFPVCPSEPPSTEKETGLPPSLLEASVPLISPAVVPVAPPGFWPSSAISASPPEAQDGDAVCPGAIPAAAGPEQPAVPCSPPPGHGVALGAPAELPTFTTGSAAPCFPVSGLEHEAMGFFNTKTVMEADARATPTAVGALSQQMDEFPQPPDLPFSAPLSSMGSSSALPPSLSPYYAAGTDAVLYGRNSVPSTPGCPSLESSFSPALPGPISADQSPLAMLSPEAAWFPMQGVPATTDSLRVKPPFRPLSVAEPNFASAYKHEDRGIPWAAIKPEPHLLPLSPSHPPPRGRKGKPPKHRKDPCVFL